MLKKNFHPLNEDEGNAEEAVLNEEEGSEEEPAPGEEEAEGEEIDFDELLSKHGDSLREKLLGGYKEKVKINGEERELTLEDMRRFASKGYAADEKFKSAAEMRKEAEEAKALAESMSKKDLFDLIKERGITNAKELEEHFVDLYTKMQEEENLSPEAKRLREMEAKMQAYEEEKAAKKREEEEARYLAEVEKAEKELTEEFAREVEKSKLPRNSFIFAQVAHQLENSANIGYDMPVSEAVQIVEENLMGEILPGLLKDLPEERKRSVLGEDFVKALMEGKLSEAKNVRQSFKQPSRQRPSSKQTSSKQPAEEYLDMDDFFNSI